LCPVLGFDLHSHALIWEFLFLKRQPSATAMYQPRPAVGRKTQACAVFYVSWALSG
jgi:hypothetical protein